MAAFGVSGAAVEEQLLKVQSAMAISQGLQGIKESISSFTALGASIKKTAIVQKLLTSSTWLGQAAQWALNVAMNANPIGAIILAITALTGAIVYYASMANDAAEVNDRLTASIDRGTKAMDKSEAAVRKNMERRMQLLEANGASEEELHKERLLNLKKEEKIREINLQKESIIIDQKRKVYKRALEQGNTDLAKEIKTEIQQSKDKYSQLESLNGDYHHNLTIENKNFEKEQEEKRKADYEKRLANYKDFQSKRLAISREIQDREIELIKNELDREKETNKVKRERELQGIKESGATTEEARKLRDLINEKWDRIEAERTEVNHENFKVRKLEQGIEIGEIEVSVKQEYATRTKFIADQERIDELNSFVANADAKLQMAKDGFSAISDLATAFAGESEAQQKRAFQINKIAGIAQATIDTVTSAGKAFASQLVVGDPTSVIRAGIAAAIATASGVARVATIAKTKFGGGGSDLSSSSSSVSLPSGGGSRPAEFNIVGNTGVNQLAQSLGQQPLKAFVVAADVTSQQSLDRNKIETASL